MLSSITTDSRPLLLRSVNIQLILRLNSYKTIGQLWHQSLLIDYFMGKVEVMPRITTNTENSTSIQELELFGRKKERKTLGTIKLQIFTYEDLRAF